MEMRDDDAFWAARRVAAFTDDLIRAAVHTGEFSDPAAEKYLGDVLIKRRDKIASIYLTAVNPIVVPAAGCEQPVDVRERGRRGWRGERRRRPTAPRGARFDNATGETRPLSETQSATTTIEAPSGLPTAAGSFIEVDISADSDAHPTWKQPIRTYFRRGGDGWKLVGLERLPEDRPGSPATPSR